MKNKYCGEVAYNTDIASSYEADRKIEALWNIEQNFMRDVVCAIPEHSSLLDIPVGTGRFLEYYNEQKLNVHGIDISESMLSEAIAKLCSNNITLEVGDARSLKFDDKSFDYVICWRLLHLLPQKILKEVIRELARVATGKLYIQAYVKDDRYLILKFKNIYYRYFSKKNYQTSTLKPWSHIQSFNHEEQLLLHLFRENNLLLKYIELLGEYGSLRVKVYVLERQ